MGVSFAVLTFNNFINIFAYYVPQSTGSAVGRKCPANSSCPRPCQGMNQLAREAMMQMLRGHSGCCLPF